MFPQIFAFRRREDLSKRTVLNCGIYITDFFLCLFLHFLFSLLGNLLLIKTKKEGMRQGASLAPPEETIFSFLMPFEIDVIKNHINCFN